MDETEVARVTSPDTTLDLVLTEANPGATSSYVYHVRILPRGAGLDDTPAAARLYGATRNTQAYGADLHWQGPDTAVVDYLQAKSITAPADAIDVAGHAPVRLLLRAGIENPSAPAGGMARR